MLWHAIDAFKSAPTVLNATDLVWRMGYAEVQVLSPFVTDQTTLLPPSTRKWLAEEHPVYFLLDLVDD